MSAIATDPAYKGVLPSDFIHGYATASYQIEGAYDEGGRGMTVWETALKPPMENGNTAANSYHMWKEDIKLLKQYGANSYRFSIAWSRIVPLGGKDDPVNEEGIKWYSDFIDALLAEGITPFVTLFHWDLPQALQDRYAGFETRTSSLIVDGFVRYSKICFERFGDRVKHWITFNEPFVYAIFGAFGFWSKDFDVKKDTWVVGHNEILCHAHAVDLYRREFQPTQQGCIGITLNCDWAEPIDSSPEAAKASGINFSALMGWFADPIYLGTLDPHLSATYGKDFPDFTPEEWKLVKGSSDFYGLNHYGTKWATGKLTDAKSGDKMAFFGGGVELVDTKDGKVIGYRGQNGHPYDVPWGFRKLLQHVHKRYTKDLGLPIIVTENGFAIDKESEMTLEQIIDDKPRQTYYNGYLKEICDAVTEDGIKISGYLAWSLLDNLEWMMGYVPRFGCTFVDRENGFVRHPKDSTKLLKAIFENTVAK